MKFILILFAFSQIVFTNINAYAQSDLERDLEYCSRACSRDCHRVIRRTQNLVDEVRRNCGVDDDDGRDRYSNIRMFHSDSCNGEYLGSFSSRMNCDDLRTVNQRVWGVEINGTCENIEDTTAIGACYALQNYSRRSVLMYRSDSCAGGLVAAVDSYTNCSQLARHVSSNVWAIKVNDSCINIADDTFSSACVRHQNER